MAREFIDENHSQRWSTSLLRFITRWLVRGSATAADYRDSTNEDDMTMTDLTRAREPAEKLTRISPESDDYDDDEDDEEQESSYDENDEVLLQMKLIFYFLRFCFMSCSFCSLLVN